MGLGHEQEPEINHKRLQEILQMILWFFQHLMGVSYRDLEMIFNEEILERPIENESQHEKTISQQLSVLNKLFEQLLKEQEQFSCRATAHNNFSLDTKQSWSNTIDSTWNKILDFIDKELFDEALNETKGMFEKSTKAEEDQWLKQNYLIMRAKTYEIQVALESNLAEQISLLTESVKLYSQLFAETTYFDRELFERVVDSTCMIRELINNIKMITFR